MIIVIIISQCLTYIYTTPTAMYDGCGSVALVYWLRLKKYL